MMSKEFHLDNCRKALEYWLLVHPDTVELSVWECNTHACFGGHLRYWPHFQQFLIPLSPNEPEPILRNSLYRHSSDIVSEELFGVEWMFTSASMIDVNKSDHQVIVDRLLRRIHELEKT